MLDSFYILNLHIAETKSEFQINVKFINKY